VIQGVGCERDRGFSHIRVNGLSRKGLEARFGANDPTIGRALPEKSQRQRCVALLGAGFAEDAGAVGVAVDDAAGGAVLAADVALAELAAAGCAFCHACSSAASYQ
jgi:hypothetical protein